MEYIYFFARNDFWHEIDFYTTFGVQHPYEFIIPDSLLVDKLIKEHGYPLKGRGYAVGIKCRNEKIYMDFLMTSMYFAHIAVQCDDSGKYVSGGDIIFPLSWDTEEKRNSAVLKGFRFHRDKPCKQCKLSGDKENVDIGYSIQSILSWCQILSLFCWISRWKRDYKICRTQCEKGENHCITSRIHSSGDM